MAIELDGRSHDAVKDTAFRSAGLPLLRVRTEETHTPTTVEALLRPYLHPAECTLVST